MEKVMMIDYRNDNDEFVRKEIDDMEFCVRNGNVYFISDGEKFCIQLESVSQVYLN